MRRHTVLATFILTATLAVSTIAPAQPNDQHGTVNFPNSCSPAVQEKFQRAVAMLHSFRYGETEKAFREVLADDPTCAIATWGIATILMSNPLAGVSPAKEWSERGQAALEQGKKIGAKTPREQRYIEAVGAYYEDWPNRPERTRQLNRAKAYQALAERYPEDDEAQIFYALYLAGTQSLADQSYKSYLMAADILEKQFAKYPNHPGVAHYLIHSYDAPPIADKGLTAARRYASIAPAAPHALHMPSHIFTRVGAWKESAETNARSAAAAKAGGDGDEQAHAMDYMVYAYLQMARDDDARRVMDDSGQLGRITRFAAPYALAAMPARYAVERGDWQAARTLEPRKSTFPFADALTYYARGLGAARTGDAAGAEKEAQELARLRDALKTAKSEYWATEVDISRAVVMAWATLAQGKTDEALTAMRAAADAEDRHEKHIVTPGRLLPARELLGEMLLQAKRPAEALKEFETVQKREPERFRAYAGAARAAVLSADKAKAKQYYTKLVELGSEGGVRPELAQARAFIAATP